MSPRRKEPQRTRIGWIWGGAAVLLVVVFAVVYLYRGVHREEWLLERAAAETVTSATYMRKVTETVFFNGEKPYSIVYGEDEGGRPMIGWVGPDETHAEFAEDGVGEEEIRSKVAARAPDVEILRIVPGKVEGVYAWEVFYKRDTEQGVRYFYDYFRFRDGVHLDTYKMAVSS